MRVAVIGSGLAGLTTAYLLRREGADVYLIERSSKLGFHAASVQIDGERAKESSGWIVDVPMRGFQGGYYPLLISLYKHLGLPIVTAKYAFSFSSSSGPAFFIHSGASGASIPHLPSQAFKGPVSFISAVFNFLGVTLCYLLLLALSFLAWHDLLPPPLSKPGTSLRHFTTYISALMARPVTVPIIKWSPWTPLGDTFEKFIGTIVLPLFSAVGTMTSDDVWDLPVRVLLEYVHTTLGTSHYHLGEGLSAADVADLLSAPVRGQGSDYIRTNTEVTSLEYAVGGGVRIKLRATGNEDGEEESLRVEKVVLATQTRVAQSLLGEFEASLKQWGEEKERRRVRRMAAGLRDVRFRETIVVNHRDSSILPPYPDRRDINLYLPAPSPLSESISPTKTPYFAPTSDNIYTMATQIIPPPRRSGLMPVFQTTNPVVPIDSGKVLSVSRLERALPISNPSGTLERLRSQSINAFVYLAGSYASPGIPLLEGCVGSAKFVVEKIVEADRYRHEKGLGDKKKRGNDRNAEPAVGGVDWRVGRGGKIMRAWRWRWRKDSHWSPT